MQLKDLIQTGNYIVVNPAALFAIWPKYVPEASHKGLYCFHFSKSDDPTRQGVHRLFLAESAAEAGTDNLGRFSPVPTYGPKLLHVKYNNRRGLDFHVLPRTDREGGNCPPRAIRIERGACGNSQCFTILGETQERQTIQIAYFSITGVLSTHKNGMHEHV